MAQKRTRANTKTQGGATSSPPVSPGRQPPPAKKVKAMNDGDVTAPSEVERKQKKKRVPIVEQEDEAGPSTRAHNGIMRNM